ncbi:MAG TPA: response regulator [Pyrinomonadaceae bacterium]|jgi:CheY-like chemotaxis protein/anti-anti-sigma regulatory factor
MVSSAGAEMQPQETVNILMVDDHPQNLMALEAVLGDMGQNLVRAGSGREALKRLLEEDFALILLDVQMPGLDGYETAALAREREQSRHTPIIFLTAINQSEAQVFKGYSSGAVDYIFKPFVPEVLRAKVSVFVDLYRSAQEVRRQAELLRQANRELESEVAERLKAEEALHKVHEELEARVERRTAQLARANAELEEQSAERLRAERERARLQEEVIRMQAAMLEELSTPLIPLSDGVVIMPLVGTIDSKRAAQVLEVVSWGVVSRGARIAIIDITGVPTVDSHVASVLVRAAQAVRLLGAEVVLTGIRSKVARSLVELGVDLGGLVTRGNLQAGIAYARSRL